MRIKAAGVLIACAIALSITACGRKDEATEKTEPIRNVKIEKVVSSPVDAYYEATGTVRSKTTNVVSSRIMGSIIAMSVREGDRVRAGQTLIEIDNREATAQVKRAQAGVREAESAVDEIERNLQGAASAKAAAEAGLTLAASTYNRYKALMERRSVSPQEFDEVQAKYKVAEAETERATRMLSSLAARKNQVLAKLDQAKAEVTNAQIYASYGRVLSPIDGIVTAKQAELGAMAAPGVPLLTLEDHSQYRLEASVEESKIGAIHVSDPVQVQIDALGDEQLSGTVSEIVPTADPASRSHIVKIDLPARPALRSGSFGRARFSTEQKQAITIPRRAITERGQLVSVFVVDDSGTTRLRLIQTGKAYGDRIEVLTGLSDGERIVVDRVEAVSDGSRIESI